MPLTRAALRLRDLLRGRPLGTGGVARLESASLMVGLGGMATALGVTMAQATLPPIIDTEAALRRLVENHPGRPREARAALCEVLELGNWACDNAGKMLDIARNAMREQESL